jgi:hypothetical protein
VLQPPLRAARTALAAGDDSAASAARTSLSAAAASAARAWLHAPPAAPCASLGMQPPSASFLAAIKLGGDINATSACRRMPTLPSPASWVAAPAPAPAPSAAPPACRACHRDFAVLPWREVPLRAPRAMRRRAATPRMRRALAARNRGVRLLLRDLTPREAHEYIRRLTLGDADDAAEFYKKAAQPRQDQRQDQRLLEFVDTLRTKAAARRSSARKRYAGAAAVASAADAAAAKAAAAAATASAAAATAATAAADAQDAQSSSPSHFCMAPRRRPTRRAAQAAAAAARSTSALRTRRAGPAIEGEGDTLHNETR